MSTPIEGKTCSKCKKRKQLNDFYTKGNRLDSKCKECAKKARVNRYKKKKSKTKKRNYPGRLMKINTVTFVEKFESNGLKKQSLCKAVNGILEDHLFKVVSEGYLKGKKNAA